MPLQLKEIYNQKFFFTLNKSLKKFHPKFNEQKFLTLIFDANWKKRELKQRMRHISNCLNQSLTNSYPQNIQILQQVARNINLNDKLSSLSLVIFADYVEAFGLNNLPVSLNALEFFTEYGSSEFAIRHFLVKYEKETIKQLFQWAKSKNYHIRRLASEGCRPRLPWGIALEQYKKNPSAVISILEILKDDNEEYVRRSVANNLNDIAKDNPEIALNLAEKWLKNSNPNRRKLVKHGLRGLLKKGNTKALKLFGITPNHHSRIESFDLEKTTITINGGLEQDLKFSFKLANQQKSRIRLEYALYFLVKNGKFSRKIFQITEREFEKGEVDFRKKHSFRKITTRKYYAGGHKLGLVVNGVEVEVREFDILF